MSATSYAGLPTCPLVKGHSNSLTNSSRISPTRRRSSFSSIPNSEHSLSRFQCWCTPSLSGAPLRCAPACGSEELVLIQTFSARLKSCPDTCLHTRMTFPLRAHSRGRLYYYVLNSFLFATIFKGSADQG